jgi:hypothetical protein
LEDRRRWEGNIKMNLEGNRALGRKESTWKTGVDGRVIFK